METTHDPAINGKPTSLDDLVEQIIRKLQDGESVAIDDLAARYPQHAAKLQALVPIIQSMAELGSTDPSAAGSSPMIPARIGRYRVITVRGEGGFGTVYLGVDEELQRQVAIKVPHAWRSSDNRYTSFLAEVRVLAQLEQAAIVPVYDVGQMPDGRCYAVSKYIAGSDLATRIARGERFSYRQTAKLIAAVAEALTHAHQQGIVHRDVKPANILLDEREAAYLADFGLALIRAHRASDEILRGTVKYMSPEQARGNGQLVDGRSDIYSLGAVFYELLTGSPACRAESRAEQLKEVLHTAIVPPRQYDAAIPGELETICLKCLAKEPTQRYSTAADLARDLRRWMTRQDPDVRKRRLAIVAIGCVALVALGSILVPRFWHATSGNSGELPAPITKLELHVRRDRDDKKIESRLLMQHGIEQDAPALTALGPDDHFKLIVDFPQPTSWYLVHFDPVGAFEIVDTSSAPQATLEFPLGAEMAGFKPDDPKGVNLLLLITGPQLQQHDLGRLSGSLESLRGLVQRMPAHWSQVRAGVTKDYSLAQLSPAHLADIGEQLPAGLKVVHALFLRTATSHDPP